MSIRERARWLLNKQLMAIDIDIDTIEITSSRWWYHCRQVSQQQNVFRFETRMHHMTCTQYNNANMYLYSTFLWQVSKHYLR